MLVTLQTLILRRLLNWRAARAAKFHEQWNIILIESLDGEQAELPQIAESDLPTFLMMWNYLQESVRDEAQENLNKLARTAGVERAAQELLAHGKLPEKMLAANTLGCLKTRAAWNELKKLISHPDALLSLSAAKALMRIDARRAVSILLEQFAARSDWAAGRVAAILRDAGSDVISEPLARAALGASRQNAPRLIRFLELAHANAANPVVKKILAQSADMETITACLRIFNDPEDLEMIRSLLKNQFWQVRLQATSCLGRIGTFEDEARLVEAAADLEWWVRYRAAQALANLPFITEERLHELAATHSNQFARDIINQVIAENNVQSNSEQLNALPLTLNCSDVRVYRSKARPVRIKKEVTRC